jgi:polyisoprenoid-binding protein YceI
MTKLITILCISYLSTQNAFAVDPSRFSLDLANAKGDVVFHAVGRPSAIKINGKLGMPKGRITVNGSKISGILTLPLENLDTGIKLRDKHAKEKYLETSKYPEAKLELTSIQFPKPLPAGDFSFTDVPFIGNLTLHGHSQKINGNTKVEKKDSQISISSLFKTKISDYGIATPSFMEISLADTVEVDASFSGPITMSGNEK